MNLAFCYIFQISLCGHSKMTESCLQNIVIQNVMQLSVLAQARRKPENIGLQPANLLWRKLLGLREFILFYTSRASCGDGETKGADITLECSPPPSCSRNACGGDTHT
ncbi:hypothetical protein KIL84_015065 [Mauremys mutica]|uniref:Uncharacterized protein n=1 Tax=Mauremys mutica TaxID=74926 RepID=A0A9D3XMX2_9SAUR|nr:hypothetical protein KIL84_015065 [Mauremys mutica]